MEAIEAASGEGIRHHARGLQALGRKVRAGQRGGTEHNGPSQDAKKWHGAQTHAVVVPYEVDSLKSLVISIVLPRCRPQSPVNLRKSG
jgi:hypothetical protein